MATEEWDPDAISACHKQLNADTFRDPRTGEVDDLDPCRYCFHDRDVAERPLRIAVSQTSGVFATPDSLPGEARALTPALRYDRIDSSHKAHQQDCPGQADGDGPHLRGRPSVTRAQSKHLQP